MRTDQIESGSSVVNLWMFWTFYHLMKKTLHNTFAEIHIDPKSIITKTDARSSFLKLNVLCSLTFRSNSLIFLPLMQ